MSGNFSSVPSLKYTHAILVSIWKFLPDLLIAFLGWLSAPHRPLGTVKAVTVTALTLEPRTQRLLCKPIWWLGGWHILSGLETLLGLTDRASWGRGRRACPTVLWKTRHRGRPTVCTDSRAKGSRFKTTTTQASSDRIKQSSTNRLNRVTKSCELGGWKSEDK